MKPLFTLAFSIFISFALSATNRTAIGNSGTGWANANNWSPSGVPQNGDTVTIPAGFTISVKGTIYPGTAPGIFVNIYGTLDFDPSGRIDLSSNGVINIHLGGAITSNGTSSELIRINGVTKFSGQTDVSVVGPSHASSSTGSSPGGFQSGLLPVKLISFSAKKITDAVVLKWETAEEFNSVQFEVEKSTDGIQWQYITSVPARGRYSGITSYSATDRFPSNGTTLYRLKSVDLDSRYEYSNILRVSFSKENNIQVLISPNPTTTQFSVSLNNNNPNDIIHIQLFNQNGQMVKSLRDSASLSAVMIDVSGLVRGSYSVVVSDSFHKIHSGIVIIR